MKSLGDGLTVQMADIARASFQPEAVVVKVESGQPKTLKRLRKDFLSDRNTNFKKDGSPISAATLHAYDLVTQEFLDIVKQTQASKITKQDLKGWVANFVSGYATTRSALSMCCSPASCDFVA